VQAVGVLGRVDELEHRVLVDARRERQLHDVARDGRIRVEALDRGPHVGLGGVGREVDADRLDAHLRAVAVLAGDVRAGSRVVAHEERAEAGDEALLAQGADPHGQLGLDGRRGRDAVEHDRGHWVRPS
jgi:hypothetical protein